MSAGDQDYNFNEMLKCALRSSNEYVNNTHHTYNSNAYNPLIYQPVADVDYEEPFKKLITIILGSPNVSQELKDEFINRCIGLSEFRKYVKEYYPDYVSKVDLWERLHSGNTE